MSLRLAKPEHEVAYQDLCQLVNRHASKLTSLELLAVAREFGIGARRSFAALADEPMNLSAADQECVGHPLSPILSALQAR